MGIIYSSCTFILIGLAGIGFVNRFNKHGSAGKVDNNSLLTVENRIHQDSLILPGATPLLISSQFNFTEGPAVNKNGNIFFTDQPNDKIWKYDINGRLSVFLDKTGRSNGLYFDHKGNLLACADEKNELWCITTSGKITVLVKDINGKQLNGPNDLWVQPIGAIYFTDPYYQRPYWTRTGPEIKGEKVYVVKMGQHTAVPVVEDLVKPNGIVGTPDGKHLYIADIGANKTYKYSIAPDGSLKDKKLFVEQGADGMTLDNKGNLYLTGNGVTVYDPSGKRILHIPIPANWTANVCFGGKERNILFITASESIYTLAMMVKGVE